MNILRIAAVLALLASATSVSAEQAAQPAPGERKVCFLEARTGSNIKQRVCMTEAERERRRKEDQEAMSNLKNSSSARSNVGLEPKIGTR
jgi:Skp family chaperone for outer membrane proteins